MSGGFFRGTSADQDTRFSNKQAKLLKSQKFAPELENLVDMTKVKMDVMRPWIAKRVTELIGFEDEVLINFIYGLLEGKFMKELWALLLSAQQNVSGVPQQFLDAKEEETKKKKAETDRIANEIQRKKEKEKQEIEQEKLKMHDAGGSSIQPADEKERYKRNGRRRHSRDSQSPDSSHHSPSLRRRPRSTSGAPPSRSRSVSPEKRYRSSPRRSVSPRRRHIVRRSPSPWHRSSYSKRSRRSPSPARYKVRSPWRRRSRSPLRRRSRSPLRRRSRTPIRRSSVRGRSRTPLRRRSPSPVRRRSPSPMQGRSLSPVRGRSPSFVRRRSPSPVHRSSLSPVRRRSPSPLQRRSPSPLQRSPSPARRRYRRSPSTPHQRSISPVRRRSSMHVRKRSFTPVPRRSPQESSSPSDMRRSSHSPVRRGPVKSARSPIQSPGERARRHEKYSPARRASPKERTELPAENRKGMRSVERRPVVSLRSPQRDMLDRNDLRGKARELSPSMRKSPFVADASRGRSYSEERRSSSPRSRERMARPDSSNPLRKAAGDKPGRDSSGTSANDENKFSSREIGEYKYRSSGKISPTPMRRKDSLNSAEVRGLTDGTNSQKTQLPSSDLMIPAKTHHKEHRERQELSTTSKTTGLSVKERESYDDGGRAKDKKIAIGGFRLPEMEALKSQQNDQNGSFDSPTKENDEHKVKAREKRKHKKSDRQEVESDDYSSSDSYEERKVAKRRRKEEKKLKKEERRRRREERRRRKDERRAEKLQLKSGDAGSLSSDLERDHSEDESAKRKASRASYPQETESEQKRLEIELREKALESLRAKKGIGN
ncbi:hypothetical protein DH2020_047658 [Rehmannia glutinosa]|uniref:PWI domain-containing protein n=1 Tax=Rehmannia glutinosa TaxID=99300 RepID=A0ABR0U8W1_REHGL